MQDSCDNLWVTQVKNRGNAETSRTICESSYSTSVQDSMRDNYDFVKPIIYYSRQLDSHYDLSFKKVKTINWKYIKS